MGTLARSLAVFGVAGALLAGVASLALSDKYQSLAIVHVQQPGKSAMLNTYLPELEGAVRNALSRDSLVGIMEKERLYERERASQPMEEVVNRMRKDITINLRGSDAFGVTFDGTDAAQAQRTTRDLVERLLEAVLRSRETGTLSRPLRFELREDPTLPQTPVRPNRVAIIGFGLGAGLLLGVGATIIRRRTPQAVG